MLEQFVEGGDEDAPVMVLTRMRESHDFADRRILLNDVIKVGRAVAKFKPSRTNAIFDCKVLSRSHALIWYRDGRFWLRDTNSSNGTFVNNMRILKVCDEGHADRELFSGDIVRFGVDVIERDTTHGCIIAEVTLYHPDGVEAKSSCKVNGDSYHTEQLIRLKSIVNEALFREQMMDSKMESMNMLLQEVREISEAGWHAMLNEEQLLHKLDAYEGQIAALKKNLPKDSMESHLCEALEEKFNLEKASKLMLQRVLDEKTDALCKATELEGCLADSERECARLRQDCEVVQEAYQTMARDYEAKVAELEKIEVQLRDVDSEKNKLEFRLKEHSQDAELLQKKLSDMRLTRSDLVITSDSSLPATEKATKNEVPPFSAINGLDSISEVTDNSDQLGGKMDAANDLRSSLSERADLVREQMAELNNLDRICDLQDRVITSEDNLEQMLDVTNEDISGHLTQSVFHFGQSQQWIHSLQAQLDVLSRLLPSIQTDNSSEQNTTLDSIYEISSTELEAEPDPKPPGLAAVLKQARDLADNVATCYGQVEASLTSFVQHRNQNLSVVCTTKGDSHTVPLDFLNAFEEELNKPIDDLTDSLDVISISSSSTVNDTETLADNTMLEKLRGELRLALNEAETSKQLAENWKQQDTVKSELLLSVRTECDALRERIAQIESTVASSRADHQRLASEAKRAQAEADELRRERDELSRGLIASSHEMDALRALVQLASTEDPPPHLSHDTNALEVDESIVVEQNLTSSSAPPGTDSITPPSPVLSSESAWYRSSTALLFAIIPIMVILCALMTFIFSQFKR